MGFAELHGRKRSRRLGRNVEAASTWLAEHDGDKTLDEPIAKVPTRTLGSGGGGGGGGGGVAKSIRCVETGKLFRSVEEAQAYANKTGKSNFEECTEEKKPLTAEEKKAKIEELKARAAQRRAEREGVEAVEDRDREKSRIEGGKKAQQTNEELQARQRKLEAERARREKLDAKRERDRLRAEIAKDKAERRARGGKLSSVLSVEGYAPNALQGGYGEGPDADDSAAQAKDADGDAAMGGAKPAAAAKPAAKPTPSAAEPRGRRRAEERGRRRASSTRRSPSSPSTRRRATAAPAMKTSARTSRTSPRSPRRRSTARSTRRTPSSSSASRS